MQDGHSNEPFRRVEGLGKEAEGDQSVPDGTKVFRTWGHTLISFPSTAAMEGKCSFKSRRYHISLRLMNSS